MKKLLILTLSLFFLSGITSLSWAGYELKISDQTKATFGVKAQIWAQSLEDAAPSGENPKYDFAVRTFRIYTSGQIIPIIKFGANADFSKGSWDGAGTRDTATVRDAFITLDLAPEAKVMAGLYRTPFSRTALQDSFGYILPHAPDIAGASYVGGTRDFRNAGLTFWGDAIGGKLKYGAGILDRYCYGLPFLNSYRYA